MNYSSKNRPRRVPKSAPLVIQKAGRVAFLSLDEVILITGVGRRTAQAWRRDPASIPTHMRQLLEMRALGVIPGFPETVIKDGVITASNGLRFTAEQLAALTYVYQELSELRREVQRQRNRIGQLDTALDRYREKSGQPMAVNDSE